MNFFRIKILALAFVILYSPVKVSGEVLTKDTVWSGEVTINDDVLIPEGVTLTILPGTTVSIEPSDKTKTDAEYISAFLEITVRGRLSIEGEKETPVLFYVKADKGRGNWSGIIIDGGAADIRSCTIRDADAGIFILKGFLNLKNSILKRNRYGLIAYGKGADVRMNNTQVSDNEYGVYEIAGARIVYDKSSFESNRKKDLYVYGRIKDDIPLQGKKQQDMIYKKSDASCRNGHDDFKKLYTAPDKEIIKRYDDEVLLKDTVWRGRIQVNGIIRVPQKIRLIIMPGAVIEFTKKDTNKDGIGENGILMQGILIAKGTGENPIIFRSGERQRSMADWDAVNIMDSDGVQNLIEYCLIEDAYRGLHFHFSNVMVNESVLKNNYMAIQFQESAVEMRGDYIYGNKGGVKARDSEVVFTDNSIFDNINGVNFFRTNLMAANNKIFNNVNEAFKIREGSNTLQENLIDCNRFGLMLNDIYFGKFSRNVISNNYETGVAVKNSDNVDLSGNFIEGSGFNGISILSSGAVIKENHISENGEAGIGIQSFTGMITENNFINNGLYAIENEGVSDIPAPLNWWGSEDAGRVIYDREDDPMRGKVLFSPVREAPLTFLWPLISINANVSWSGNIYLQTPLAVYSGATLRILPDTKVLFSKGSGIKISNGKILAVGEKNKRIVFTSTENNPLVPPLLKEGERRFEDSLWDEILLEHADGSEFSFCDFEYAQWAIHSHFTNLKVSNCRFKNNQGGIRFRSGPVEIRRSSFTENRTGIRAYFGNADIRENFILNNEIGIFVREKGGGLTIRRNNIHLNKNYNIRVGDFNTEDIDARENWWGGGNPAETIFDGSQEAGIGEVIYEPYLKAPVMFNAEGLY